MVELRPLIVVTGTVHVEGGDTNKVRDDDRTASKKTARGGSHITVVTDRTVTPSRRAANVISTDYARRLMQIRVLRTLFGSLVSAERRADVEQMCLDIGRKIADYYSTKRGDCAITNGVLWEPLAGKRKMAVAAWVEARVAAGDEEVILALPGLAKSSA